MAEVFKIVMRLIHFERMSPLACGHNAPYLRANSKWRACKWRPSVPNGAGAFPIAVETPAPNPPDPTALYAALDLGTNSCRMLIAQPKGSQFHVLDSFSKSVQLGQGLESSGKLSRASMNRTVNAMRICRQKLERHGVTNMRLGGNRGLPSCA